MKYARFQDPDIPNLTSIVEREDDDLERPFLGDIRVSEWVDVEFPPLAPEVIVPARIAALDRQAEEVKAEFTAKLREIADAKASLLALTHEVAK